MNDEIRYKLLKILEQDPSMSQRDVAQLLGISLGKTNYCFQALKEKGLVKVRNFKQNPNKRRYMYMLTPQGIDEKARVTRDFLKRKIEEHAQLKTEIELLRKEVDGLNAADTTDQC